MSEHTHTEFVPCCFRCELSRDEVPPSLTLHGDDTLMWVVDGVPVATATRDEVLAALAVPTDDFQWLSDGCDCQWNDDGTVTLPKDQHNAMWRIVDAVMREANNE